MQYHNGHPYVETHLTAVCPECGDTQVVRAIKYGNRFVLDDKLYYCTECAMSIKSSDIEGNN